MKTKHILSIITMAMSINAAAQGIGFKLENMDRNEKPGTDFYRYACGGWIKANPLKPEYARFGSFDIVDEENDRRIREIIEGFSKQKNTRGTLAQKIGDLYTLRMDSVRMNREGVRPVLKDLKQIQKVKTKEQWFDLLNRLNASGISFGELWGCGVGADMMNSKQNLLHISQGGYTIQRDYYVKDDEANRNILDAYKQHVVNILKLVGYKQAEAEQKMQNVLAIESRMAKAGKSNVERRDPASNYHKMAFSDFLRDFPGFDWTTYFANLGYTDIDSIDVGQPEATKEALKVIAECDLQSLKDLTEWQVLNSSGNKLRKNHSDFLHRSNSRHSLAFCIHELCYIYGDITTITFCPAFLPQVACNFCNLINNSFQTWTSV